MTNRRSLQVKNSDGSWSVINTGVDIPEGGSSIPVNISELDALKLSRMDISGMFISESRPAGLEEKDVWLCKADFIKQPPAISTVFDQYVQIKDSILFPDDFDTVPIFLFDDYDVNTVSLSVIYSSVTGIVPISALRVRGSGETRFIDVKALPVAGESIIALKATDQFGNSSSVTFRIVAVSDVKTITATAGTHGVIIPSGNVLIPETGTVIFTGKPDSGYAVKNFVVTDELGEEQIILSSAYPLGPVNQNYQIHVIFDIGFNINSSVVSDGRVSPAGDTGVVSGGNIRVMLIGNYGYIPDSVIIDNGQELGVGYGSISILNGDIAVINNGDVYFNAVTTNHNIIARFKPATFRIIWDLINGTLNGLDEGDQNALYGSQFSFVVAASSGYEVDPNIQVLVNNVIVGIGPAITITVTGDMAIKVTFRIKAPASVTGLVGVVAGPNSINLSWNSAARASGYFIYWTTDPLFTTPQSIYDHSNDPIQVNSTSFLHQGLTEEVPVSYTVRAFNITDQGPIGSAISLEPYLNAAPVWNLNYPSVGSYTTWGFTSNYNFDDPNNQDPTCLVEYRLTPANAAYGSGTWTPLGQKAKNTNFAQVFNNLAVLENTLEYRVTDGAGSVLPYTFLVTIPDDTSPDVFSFAAQTGVALGIEVLSNQFIVSGINKPAAISVIGGYYQKNGGTWTNTGGTVVAGDIIRTKLTSSNSKEVTLTSTVAIGDMFAGFNVTTMTSYLSFTADISIVSSIPPTHVLTNNNNTMAVTNYQYPTDYLSAHINNPLNLSITERIRVRFTNHSSKVNGQSLLPLVVTKRNSQLTVSESSVQFGTTAVAYVTTIYDSGTDKNLFYIFYSGNQSVYVDWKRWLKVAGAWASGASNTNELFQTDWDSTYELELMHDTTQFWFSLYASDGVTPIGTTGKVNFTSIYQTTTPGGSIPWSSGTSYYVSCPHDFNDTGALNYTVEWVKRV